MVVHATGNSFVPKFFSSLKDVMDYFRLGHYSAMSFHSVGGHG